MLFDYFVLVIIIFKGILYKMYLIFMIVKNLKFIIYLIIGEELGVNRNMLCNIICYICYNM